MQKLSFTALIAAATVLGTGVSAVAQTYSNAVMALKPAAYWPLTETAQPAGGLYVATNQGTLGVGGQGYYETWWQTNGASYALASSNTTVHIPGAIAGDPDTAMQQGQIGQYVVIPRTTNGVANAGVTLTAPFSIEMWIYPTNAAAGQLKPILAEGFNTVLATNAAFTSTTEGTALGMYSGFLYFVTFNGPNSGTKTEIDVPSSGTSLNLNQWYHIIASFDGTTMKVYTNGVLARSAAPPVNSFGQNYVPDPVSPLVIGGGNDLGISGGANVPFGGGIDEVAIYPVALSQTQVTTHYQAGTNVTRSVPYPQTITGDNPSIYLRLDDTFAGAGAPSSYPTANNYGSLAAAANGNYLPGTSPGVAGPAYAGFGSPSYAVALNGFNSGIDVGGGNLPAALSITNKRPVTVAGWFRANPADCVGRFQTILGQGDSSWRLNLDTIAGLEFNPGNGPQLQFSSVNDELVNNEFVNDGNWHFAAGVSDGTNDYLYIDGRLAKSGTAVSAVTNASPFDIILGGDPQYTAPEPTPVSGGGRWFDGSLAQVAFFTNALSAAQIQGLYGAAGVPPSIISQPVSQAFALGTVSSIGAVVGGSSPSYQWYFQGGGAVSGQTTSSLTFNPVTTGSAGSYYLVATNNYGAVTSVVVQVTAYQLQPGSYASAVEQLNPVGYWPLSETAQPPQPLNLTAVNFGTLGAAGNGFYGAWYQPSGNTWYLTNNIVQTNAITHPNDGSKAMLCNGGPGQYVIVPRNTNGVNNAGVTLTPPFSIEAWVRIGATNSALSDIISQGGTVNLNTGGPNPADPFYGGAGTNWAGVELGQYQDYFFFLCQSTNGYQSKASELDSSAYNTYKGTLRTNTWFHVVATFDGTTMTLYTNGVQAASHTGTKNSAGQYFVADPTTPLMIGGGSDVTAVYGQNFTGTIDDVAIYNEVLPFSSIQNHFQTAWGTNATYGSDYTNSVLADSPVLYYRLNDPQTQVSAGYPTATFPVATNYGTAGFAGNGVYQPGTTPGVAGPTFGGFGSNSKAVAFNGWLGSVDVGSSNLPINLNPTGIHPLTVVSWFQAGPADAPGRLQDIVGHGTSSYRLTLGTNAAENHFNPGPGPELQFSNAPQLAASGFALNDGNWHMAAGVSDGTNDYLYLDGRLALSNNTPAGINITGSSADLLIGGDSQYTYASPNTANTDRTFDGQVAQVAFWTNALNFQQIQSMFNAGGMPLTINQEPPQSETNNSGTTVTIPVLVSGSAPAYQWYSTNINTDVIQPVAGQTNASLVFSPANLNESGSYFVVATNAYSAVTSSVVQLTIVGPPIVLAQSPTQIQVFVGTTPSLQVTAQGPGTLSYQWSSNNVGISGATGTVYRPSTAEVGTSTYTCIITNTLGSVSISPISFAVIADPTAPFPARVLADDPLAYYRLDEASGTTAYDYAGGNNATYTNVTLGVPGYTSNDAEQSDPTETAVEFGDYPPANDYAGNVPPYVNFGTNGNGEFSVEAWVTQYFYQGGGDGIVALGYGGGGEQFVLDTGNGASGALRFFVRNAAGTVSAASSSALLENDGVWHHVVGVCDEAGGHVYLYLDGNLVASGTIPAGSGILSSPVPLSIGARQSGNNGGTNYDFQFIGKIDDVAVYNQALSAGQVQSHFLASGVAPVITGLTPSSNITTNQGANVVLTVSATGTAPLSYQWTDNNGNPIPWGTNATVILTNVQPSQVGNYSVSIQNLYGGPVYTNLYLAVTQVPQIVSDITPTNVATYVGEPVTLTVVVSGSEPLSYQWYQNGAAIPNATNTSYSFAALSGTDTYYLSVTNIYSAGSPLLSSTATVTGMAVTTLNTSNYTDNLKITFAGYNRGETLADFPVLVRLSTNVPGFNYNHFASPTGGDLRFTDGIRVIPSEIDQWNPNGESTVWVEVPALSGTNTAIWAYWGNPSNTTPLPGTNVWVPQPWESLPAYDVVYHLKESAFPYVDSTGQYPAVTGVAPSPVAGVVGNGEMFNNAAYLDSGDVNVGETFTISTWVNVSSAVANIQGIWANGAGGYSTAEVVLFVNDYNTGDGVLELGSGNGSAGTQFSTATGAVGFNQWHYVTATINRGAGTAQLFVDGSLGATGTVRTDFPTNSDMQLGRFTGGAFTMNGDMDEARIHGGIESTNWIWASYVTVGQTTNLESLSPVSSTITNAPTPVAISVAYSSSSGSLTLSGTGGSANGTYYVIGATNLLVPMSTWPVLSTNAFDGSGNFNVNVPVNQSLPALFLSIKQ